MSISMVMASFTEFYWYLTTNEYLHTDLRLETNQDCTTVPCLFDFLRISGFLGTKQQNIQI